MEFTKDIEFSNIVRANKTTKITYSGDLYKKQSDFIAIVYGFGENWDYTTEKEMEKTENGFTVEIEMKENFDTFNFCFRNGNYEWDNNQSFNYISAIQPAILETPKVEVQDLSGETENKFDADFILEILDGLLAEKINNIENISVETTNKQQILDDILSENETYVQSPVLMEEFNMDELIEDILNPVIHFETTNEEGGNITTFGETGESSQGLENTISDLGVGEDTTILAETQENTVESNTTTALIPTPEDTYIVSPRKLRKFYLMGKKIKIAFYKLFVTIPKLLFGTFDENNN